MRIAVNTRWLLHNKLEGMGNYTHHLLKRLVQNHPEVQFDFYFDRTPHQSFIYGPNVTAHNLIPPARHPYLWYVWNEISVKRKLHKQKPDLYFSPDGFIPTSGKTKTLNTIHDLNFEHHPEWVPTRVRNYYLKYFPLCANKATHLTTVSEFSKQDLIETYNIDPSKIDVIGNAAEDFEISDHNKLQETLVGDQPYFIFIGALNPRKNLQNIFPAFDQLENGYKLLVVGDKMHWSTEIEQAYNGIKNKEQVVFSGRLERTELQFLLSKAEALVFPSLFEGFGIPILEAFKAKTPVITAQNSSMPEVAGDAAILVDANDSTSILNAMQKISSSSELQNELIAKGLDQAQKFSWDESANKLWEVMLKTMNK